MPPWQFLMMHLVNVCQNLCITFGVFWILLFPVQWLTSIKNIFVDVRLIICYCLPSVKLFELKKKEKKLNIVKVSFKKIFFFLKNVLNKGSTHSSTIMTDPIVYWVNSHACIIMYSNFIQVWSETQVYSTPCAYDFCRWQFLLLYPQKGEEKFEFKVEIHFF